MRSIVIVGMGSFGELVDAYLSADPQFKVIAFSGTDTFLSPDVTHFKGRPVVRFSKLSEEFDTMTTEVFVAVGYRKMNTVRKELCASLRSFGFKLLTYIHPSVTSFTTNKVGENVFVFEDNTIQPFVTIGDGVILWSGNHIGHHSTIEDWVFVSSQAVVSGHCQIGKNSFLGVNSTIADNVHVEEFNLIGPSALVQKNTKPHEVWLADKAKRFPKPSSSFFK